MADLPSETGIVGAVALQHLPLSSLRVCVCVCVCVKERERQRERDRESDREKEKERLIERKRAIEKGRKRET